MSPIIQITLGNIAAGKAASRFDDHLREVVDDIARDDKDVTEERAITIKVVFSPKEDGVVYARIESSVKLAKVNPISTPLHIDGSGNLVQAIVDQRELPHMVPEAEGAAQSG